MGANRSTTPSTAFFSKLKNEHQDYFFDITWQCENVDWRGHTMRDTREVTNGYRKLKKYNWGNFSFNWVHLMNTLVQPNYICL